MGDRISDNSADLWLRQRQLAEQHQQNSPESNRDVVTNVFDDKYIPKMANDAIPALHDITERNFYESLGVQIGTSSDENGNWILEQAEDLLEEQTSGKNISKYTNKILKKGEEVLKVDEYIKAKAAKGGNWFTKFDTYTEAENNFIGRTVKKVLDYDKALGKQFTQALDTNAQMAIDAARPMGTATTSTAGAHVYQSKRGFFRDVIRGNKNDIILDQVNPILDKYATKVKNKVKDEAVAVYEKAKNSKCAQTAKNTISQTTEKISDSKLFAKFKASAESSSEAGTFSKTMNSAKTFSKAAITKSASATRIGVRIFSKATPVVQAGFAVYEVGDACVEGYEKDGLKGAIYQGEKQVVKSGCGLALSAFGAKAGAAAGTAICPGLGTIVGGAGGAVVGYIAGSEAGEYICEGVEWLGNKMDEGTVWLGDQISYGAGKAWEGLCWTGDRLKDAGNWCGDQAVWVGDRLKDAGNWCGDKAVWVGDQISYGAGKVWNAIKFW